MSELALADGGKATGLDYFGARYYSGAQGRRLPGEREAKRYAVPLNPEANTPRQCGILAKVIAISG